MSGDLQPQQLLHRKVTRRVARGAQLLVAEFVLAESEHPGKGPLLRRRHRAPLRELLDELGLLVDTRGVKPERGRRKRAKS